METVVQTRKLSLGPFNGCVEIMLKGFIPEYPMDFYGKRVHCCDGNNGECSEIVESSDNRVTLPLIELTGSVDIDADVTMDTDDRIQEAADSLITNFEIQILKLIFELARKSKTEDVDPAKIVIPIRTEPQINVGRDHVWGHMELGIALFV